MSKAQAVRFLEEARQFTERHLQELDSALEQVKNAASDGETSAIMAGEVARAMTFHDGEITALQGWAAGVPPVRKLPPRIATKPPVPPVPQQESAGSPHSARSTDSPGKRSIEERLLAMGAVPTLGGMLRVPATTARNGLAATASPAARELLRRRLNCPDGGVISSVGSGGVVEANGGSAGSSSPSHQPSSPKTPSWQEELKAKKLNATPRASRHAPQEEQVNNELAAMFAKRQVYS